MQKPNIISIKPLVLEYLNQFSFDFTKDIKKSYNKKITKFLNNSK